MDASLRDQIFCWFGLLAASSRMREILGTLPANRQEGIRKLMEASASLAPEELRERLEAARRRSAEDFRTSVLRATGVRIDSAPPALKPWLVSQTIRAHHGRANH